jgi:hypothetical protein
VGQVALARQNFGRDEAACAAGSGCIKSQVRQPCQRLQRRVWGVRVWEGVLSCYISRGDACNWEVELDINSMHKQLVMANSGSAEVCQVAFARQNAGTLCSEAACSAGTGCIKPQVSQPDQPTGGGGHGGAGVHTC